MAGKMVILCISDDPEKAYPTFMIASGALASDMEVVIFFSMSGLNIIKKGGAEKITMSNAPMSLNELIGMAKGSRLLACTTACSMMKLKKEDLIDGITMAGIPTFVNEAKDADIVLTF
jgi:predicted peroxiredoxin